MSLDPTANLTMALGTWRGYSAYEVAIQNGFEGSEADWLESLKGKDGQDATSITVNNKSAVDGNISIRGTEIYLLPGSAKTVAEAVGEKLDANAIENNLSSSATDKALSAAQGGVLAGMIGGKATAKATMVLLAADGWSGDTQVVNVAGVTANSEETHVVVSPDGSSREEYMSCDVYAAQQGEGTLTFVCGVEPSIDLTANILVVEVGA